MKLIYHLNLHCTVQYIQCEQNTNITPPPKLRLSESYQKKKKKNQSSLHINKRTIVLEILPRWPRWEKRNPMILFYSILFLHLCLRLCYCVHNAIKKCFSDKKN